MNKVMLLGRLTRDPEIRRTANNTAVANFTLAVSKRFKRENEPDADFIPIVAWSKLAEFAESYLKKGRQVVVVGRLQVRNWEDQDKRKHFITEVVADEIYFADAKPKDDDKFEKTVESIKKEIQEREVSDSEIEGFYEEPIDAPEDDLPF